MITSALPPPLDIDFPNDDSLLQRNESLRASIVASDFPSDCCIKGLSKGVANPYSDPFALSATQTDPHWLADPTIALFSRACNVLHIAPKDSTQTPIDRFARDVILADELQEQCQSDPDKPIEFWTLESYFIREKEVPPPILSLAAHPPPGVPERSFLHLRFDSLDLGVDAVEPVLVSVLLYCDKRFVSEEWRLAPAFSQGLFESLCGKAVPLNHSAAFELPYVTPSLHVVVFFSRLMSVDNGAPVTAYYRGGAKEAAQKHLKRALARNRDVLTHFAWAFAPVAEVVRGKRFKFAHVFELPDALPPAKVGAAIADLRGRKGGRYRFKLKFRVDHQAAKYGAQLGSPVVRLLEAPAGAALPTTSLAHRLQLVLRSAAFQLPKGQKGSNVYAVVSLQRGAARLPCLCSPLGGAHEAEVFTRAWYHGEGSVFDDVIAADLPREITADTMVVLRFFHFVARGDAPPASYIGHAVLPLVRYERVIQTGEYLLPVDFREQVALRQPDRADPRNAVALFVRVDSSFVVPDGLLGSFFESRGVIPEAIAAEPPERVVAHLYRILDQLVAAVAVDARQALRGFHAVARAARAPLGAQFQNYICGFAEFLALPEGSPAFHRGLLAAWAELIEERAADDGRADLFILDFLFLLVVKSIHITGDRAFGDALRRFVLAYVQAPLVERQHSTIDAFARFVNMLFDMGHYVQAVNAIAAQVAALHNIGRPVDSFISQAFTPKLISVGMRHIPEMKRLFAALLLQAKTEAAPGQPLLKTIMRILIRIPIEFRANLVNQSFEFVHLLSPISSVHGVGSRWAGFHHAILLYAFLLSAFDETPQTLDIWRRASHGEIFSSIEYMLDHAKRVPSPPPGLKEMIYAVHFSILKFLRAIASDAPNLPRITSILYRFLQSNMSPDEYVWHVNLLKQLMSRDLQYFYDHVEPGLPEFLNRLLAHTRYSSYVSVFFVALLRAESKQFRSADRTLVLCARALHLFLPRGLQWGEQTDQLEQLRRVCRLSGSSKLKPINALVERIAAIDRAMSAAHLNQEERSLNMMKVLLTLRNSPDVLLASLRDLCDFHRQTGYFEEEVQTRFVIVALLLEFVVAKHGLRASFPQDYQAELLPDFCTGHELASICFDRIPRFRWFCDDPDFSLAALVRDLMELPELCKRERRGYEHALRLIDVAWPLLDALRAHAVLREMLTHFAEVSIMRAVMTADQQLLYGHYFRVAFYGAAFREQKGRSFIFRENGLTHLYDLSNRLIAEYNQILGCDVELIKESGEYDADRAVPGIQITFVEPHFRKADLRKRTSEFDLKHNISSFYFDTPFTKGDRIHGALEEQYVRRTILTVDRAMPSIMKIVYLKPSGIETKEFEPIRVSYMQLKERVAGMRQAIDSGDYRKIQQLLHGSLLVQVNEGPLKIAEIFLVRKYCGKRQDKLKERFREFLEVNRNGLVLHRRWVKLNPAFGPLQDQLEAGFASLDEKLQCYLADGEAAG